MSTLAKPLSVTFTVLREQEAAFYDLVRSHPDIFTEFRITTASNAPYPDKNIFLSYRRSDSEDQDLRSLVNFSPSP